MVSLQSMSGIQSQVTFGIGGGSATIAVGPVDAEATKVEVTWGTASSSVLVYSATTANLPAQFTIPAFVTSGTTYTLTLKIWLPGWARPCVYTGAFPASPGTSVVLVLNATAPGGP